MRVTSEDLIATLAAYAMISHIYLQHINRLKQLLGMTAMFLFIFET